MLVNARHTYWWTSLRNLKKKNPSFLALLVHFRTDFHCSKNFNDALHLSQYEYLSHPKLVFNVCPNLTLNCSCGIHIGQYTLGEHLGVAHEPINNSQCATYHWCHPTKSIHFPFVNLLKLPLSSTSLHITTTLTSSKIWHTSHFTITTRDTR
jgi:hypothetical protein